MNPFRPSRLRVAVLSTLVAAATALVLPASPAAAVAGFGPAARATPDGCSRAFTDIGSDGLSRGFALCDAGIRYVQGKGSSWTTLSTPWSGNLVGAAYDGSSTWALWSNSSGLFLTARSSLNRHSGALRMSTVAVDYGNADLIARAGKWWVVWVQPTSQGGFHLWERHSLGSTVASHKFWGSTTDANMSEVSPSLAYQPTTGTAVLAWTRGRTQSGMSTVMSTSKGGAWSAMRTVDAVGYQPEVVVSGSIVAVATSRYDSTGAVSTGTTSGMTSTHKVALGNPAGRPSVGLSSGRLTAAWSQRNSAGAYSIRVAERAGTTWTTASYAYAGYPQLADLDSFGGKARLLLRIDTPRTHLEARSQ